MEDRVYRDNRSREIRYEDEARTWGFFDESLDYINIVELSYKYDGSIPPHLQNW